MPGVSIILDPNSRSCISENVVVCWPDRLDFEIGNVLILIFESSLLINVDFPTPLWPEKTHDLPFMISFNLSILIPFFPEIFRQS